LPSPLLAAMTHPWRQRSLIRTLTWREISLRYRGSFLGALWPVITPLLMLSVYTLVFGVVFAQRWPGRAGEGGIGMFALVLLSGLLLQGLLAEVLTRAPLLVVAQPNYVKKIVFPLEVLGWVSMLSSGFHALVGLLLLVLVNGAFGTGFAWGQLALPLVWLPFCLVLMGLNWLIAALGVYVRDLAQAMGSVVMLLMFLGPVFYPREAMPEGLRGWLALNPVTIPLEQTRHLLFEGRFPDWLPLAQYAGAAVCVYAVGLWVFATLKKGFADVV